MSARKRKSYTPRFRAEAARLVIDTGRTIAEVAREIGVGEPLLGRWVAQHRAREDVHRRRWMSTSGPSWNGCGSRSPNCGWTGPS